MVPPRYPLPERLICAARAAIELGRARATLYRTTPAGVLDRNAAAQEGEASRQAAYLAGERARLTKRAAFFTRRIATRVPWRADCLVQAMACQRWLVACGIASEIVVGTAKTPSGDFESHAWLVCDGKTILGGDVTRFSPLVETGKNGGR